jgi:Ferredoxin subunits of nitrite reductase and ring-hydroxylating dioxygenases
MSADGEIAPVSDVPEDTTLLFRVRPTDAEARNTTDRESGEIREAIMVRDDEGVVGWLNYCQHFRHIKLDKGSGAEMRNGEIVCTNHGAYFEADTGYCNFGPCEGAVLSEVDLAVKDGVVRLTDDEYELVGRGGIETDPADLASKSNREF